MNKLNGLPRKITKKEFNEASKIAEKSKELLESDDFKFLINYINNEINSIVNDFLNNRIQKVVENRPLANGGSLEIEHSSINQMIELSGRFKALKDLLNYLQANITTFQSLEKLIKENQILVVENDR